MLAHQRFNLLTKSLHLDSSSFSLEGSYEIESSEESSESIESIKITYGYSKDHRPDLKQFMMDIEDFAVFWKTLPTVLFNLLTYLRNAGLFTLRAAKLAWKKRNKTKRKEPWNANNLVLYCTVDTRLWSLEGTKQLQAEKIAKYSQHLLSKKPEMTFMLLLRTNQIDKFIAIWRAIVSHQLLKLYEKEDFDQAVKNLQQYIIRLESSIEKINTPYPSLSRKLYNGKANVILGVAMGLEKPATVAIVDGNTGKAIAYRSIKQLLGKNYRLINRQRQQKQALSHLRHKAQKRSADNQKGESNLGEYVDRLIAKAVIEIAKQYQASVIAVPKIEDMREIVQSEIKVKAEAKIPGYEEGQKKYAKQYRINIHNWSYGRLIENITNQASKLGIAIAEVKQPVRGSPVEKAKDMAIAFHSKKNKN